MCQASCQPVFVTLERRDGASRYGGKGVRDTVAAVNGELAEAIEAKLPQWGKLLFRAAFDDPTKCILCASCYSACPILDGKNTAFVGPAALAQAAMVSSPAKMRLCTFEGGGTCAGWRRTGWISRYGP